MRITSDQLPAFLDAYFEPDITCMVGGHFPDLPPTPKPHGKGVRLREREDLGGQRGRTRFAIEQSRAYRLRVPLALPPEWMP